MSRLLPLALLPLAVLLGGLVRVERGLPLGAVDEETAAHLRRVELTLLEGQPPTADAFVAPPYGASLAAAPFLDGALATIAARLWGEGEFGLREEERLEAGLRWFGPLFGGLGVLLVAFLTLALVRGEWSGFAALVAGTAHALWPAAIELGAAGRIDVAVVQVALAGLGAAIVAQTVTARDMFDWVQGGLCGGLFAGMALLLGPSSLLFVPALTAGYWALVTREEGERRHAARRAGLLFALSAAVVTSLAAGSLTGEGLAARWMRGVSALAFVCGAPFLLVGALGPGRRAATGRLARGAGALVAAVLLPYAVIDLVPRLTQAASAWRVAPTELPPWPVLASGAVAWAAAWRARREEGAGAVVAWGALVYIPLALVLPAAAPPAIVCACAVLGVAVVGLPEAQRVPVAGALGVGLVGLLLAPRLQAEGEPDRSAALRSLRALPAARWDVSVGHLSGSCLAPWTLGHRVAYLGRRPPTASGFGHRAEEAATALASRDEGALAVAMRKFGAHHVLAGALVEEAWPGGLNGVPYAETALARLAAAPPDDASPLIEVLRLGDAARPQLVVLTLREVDPAGRREPSLRER